MRHPRQQRTQTPVILLTLTVLSACGRPPPTCEDIDTATSWIEGCTAFGQTPLAVCQCAWGHLASHHSCTDFQTGKVEVSAACEACGGDGGSCVGASVPSIGP